MRAVIYARYSPGPNQTEQSIEGQLRECKEYAKSNNITVIGTYIDQAMTGRNDNRADFQRMIKDSEKKIFDAVIVWKIDRFGRNREEIAINKVKFKKNGVKILYAKEHIPEGPEGIILESVLEGMAEYYSANLSQNIKRGIKESALKGKFIGGKIPLGYKLTAEKKYEIDPLTAPIVKEIFQMYATGFTVTEIINTLNKQGKRTANGTPFSNNSLSKLLHNKKYIGVYERAGVTIEGGVPIIVDETIFNQVQEQMKKNKEAPARRKSPMDFLLTTKLFCGKCNATMIGDSGTSKTKAVHYYYTCSHKKRLRQCDMKPVKKDWLESLVVKQTVKSILQDDVINHIADRIIIYLENDHDSSRVLAALQSKKKTVEKSIANIIKAIEQGIITESTRGRLLELEAEKSDIEIQELQHEIRKPQTGKKELIYWLNSFKNGDIEDIDYQRRIIDAFVNAVYVFDDKIVITYNYTDDQKQLTIEEVKTVADSLLEDCYLGSDFEDNSPL